MPIKKIQVGQVWKKDDSGDSYLVTKVYNEALATFAVLRKAGSETDAPLRVKVGHAGASPTLPGFRFAQESEEFSTLLFYTDLTGIFITSSTCIISRTRNGSAYFTPIIWP